MSKEVVATSLSIMQLSAVLLIAAATLASAETITTTQPSPEEIEKARATAVPLSPTSHVKGLAFDRFIQIWLENTVSVFDGQLAIDN